MRIECAYRVSTDVSNVVGKRECRLRVRYRFGDGTVTCAKHAAAHKAKLHGEAMVAIGAALRSLSAAKVIRAAKEMLRKGAQCAHP